MKFGIFYELQLPRPWEAGDELKLYQNALTQLETADRIGYDHAWVVEHHFLEEYSHSPSPESFLAAASQRTKRIRLGHGIFQLTTNHPARVAEKVAVLDLLSNGRCEFGMGESASITELTPFGRDMETKREVFEEAVQAIFPMFTKVGTEHHGRSRFRNRTRHCGWHVRSCRPSSAPAKMALARSASSLSAPMPRTPGCTRITMRSPSG
jgi:alkanesulfonate monooxygenase SsuD/methylene tetrahydromethanopterin reductase-like flavin-dependent oxidoreductase (luciferase family)